MTKHLDTRETRTAITESADDRPADGSTAEPSTDPRRFAMDASPRAQYQALQHLRPEFFRNHSGGVRVATAPEDIDRISSTVADQYEARGWPRAWAEVGVCYRDPYVMMLREAVVFPDGTPGIHHRLSTYNAEPSGIAVLPIIDGRIVLLRHYRHPVRSWCWEIPRGARDAGETAEACARRELAEEIGAKVARFVPVGRMCGSTGLVSMIVEMGVAEVTSLGTPCREEGIEGINLVTSDTFVTMVETEQVLDAFSIGCFFRAHLRGLV